jgi:Ca2+/Na+ antiporter
VVNSRVKVPDDIAGATYMAACTSSPELFTSLVGTFMGKADVGLGTVVGSAMFNLLVVVGLAGAVS